MDPESVIALNLVLAQMDIEGPKSSFSQKVFGSVLDRMPAAPNIPGTPIFVKVGSKVVPSHIDLLIIRKGKILLTRRDCEHFKGWHIPGGARHPKTSLLSNAQNIANRELGGCRVKSLRFFTTIDQENDPRMHHAVSLYHAEIEGDPVNGEWFEEKPADIIPIQHCYWPHIECVRGALL